jgi:hypothetical protein
MQKVPLGHMFDTDAACQLHVAECSPYGLTLYGIFYPKKSKILATASSF